MNKRDRLKKPDQSIPKFPRTCNSCKQDCDTENEAETPECEDPQKETILTYRKPWEQGKARSKENLEKKEDEKEGCPNPKITKKMSYS
jgi:hypothetical protein